MAEREGFEPPEPFGSMVFKTTAFGHSAISPEVYTDYLEARFDRNQGNFFDLRFFYAGSAISTEKAELQ